MESVKLYNLSTKNQFMEPLRIDDDGVPIYTHQQIDDFGFPEWFGVEVYRVIETRACIPLQTDFSLHQQSSVRPIHRYCRKKRFHATLYKLLNDRGRVPEKVIQLVQENMFPNRPIWNEIRTVLKENNLRLYYNRIPFIIQAITLQPPTKPINAEQYRNMLSDFDCFCSYFEQNKVDFKRTYFPSMRFVALKLMERWGVKCNYEIPFTQTFRKRKDLEILWSSFIKQSCTSR